MISTCISCQKPKKSEVVFETKHWRVVLSLDQAYLGRCFVTLKRHCGDLDELTVAEWADFLNVVKSLEAGLRKSFGATMFNWTCLLNNAYKDKPPNPHVHWHFRPRYNRKVVFAGTIFQDLEFAHHYDRARKQPVSEEIKKKITQKIRQGIKNSKKPIRR